MRIRIPGKGKIYNYLRHWQVISLNHASSAHAASEVGAVLSFLVSATIAARVVKEKWLHVKFVVGNPTANERGFSFVRRRASLFGNFDCNI